MCTSAEFDNRLIELVRANPSLYERELRKTPYDAHKKKKTELWCSIATSLETDGKCTQIYIVYRITIHFAITRANPVETASEYLYNTLEFLT